MDLMKVDRNFADGGEDSAAVASSDTRGDNPAAATINGNLGDLYNCSGKYRCC
jgi:hypothetical protein